MQLRKTLKIQPTTFSNHSTLCDLNRTYLTFCDPSEHSRKWHTSLPPLRPTSPEISLIIDIFSLSLFAGTPSPDFHSTKIALNTSGTIFPTPPSVPAPPPLPTKLVAPPATHQLQALESIVTELQKQVPVGNLSIPLVLG